MELDGVLEIGHGFLYAALLLALPALGVSLIVGLLIAIFQTITSIQEQTLSFAPRLIAVAAILAFTMSWGLQIAVHFTTRMFLESVEHIR